MGQDVAHTVVGALVAMLKSRLTVLWGRRKTRRAYSTINRGAHRPAGTRLYGVNLGFARRESAHIRGVSPASSLLYL
jgi:hypothetical protein